MFTEKSSIENQRNKRTLLPQEYSRKAEMFPIRVPVKTEISPISLLIADMKPIHEGSRHAKFQLDWITFTPATSALKFLVLKSIEIIEL